MKKILLIVCIAVTAYACVPPLKPLPPLGCNSSNAVLMYQGNSCYWVFMGCK